MYSAIVFDVNETLLDLRAMEPAFERYFGSGDLRKEWFNEVLKLAFATTVLGRYYDFGVVGRAALGILEKRHNKSCMERQRNSILSLMRELPAHADVPHALELLKERGFRLVVLTNSTASTAEAQLTHAGIRHWFQQVFSVDTVKRLKPAPEPYRMVAAQLGADPKSLLMVAAHSWDIAGAIHAGWNGAFVARPGQVLDALTPKPAFMAQDLSDLARMIIREGSPRREARVKRAK